METDNQLENIIPIEAIQERDIDLLLLEEIKSNRSFTDWFLSKTIGKTENYKFIGAWHSLYQVGLGESDLVFKIKNKSKGIIFLIENKIDADFQSEQADRYQKRGQSRKEDGECDIFHTVLVAPKRYIKQNDDFDYIIRYEMIKNGF